MKRLTVRLVVALLTFVVGVGITSVWSHLRAAHVEVTENPKVSANPDRGCAPESPATPAVAKHGQRAEESPEAKAVRLAEEFIARNGYTDLPPERDRLSYETVEWGPNDEEMLRRRRNTLERKAYGIRYGGRMSTKDGWTVVFRPAARYAGQGSLTGRAVTMDKNFQNLLVEHKDFFLAKVDKKF